MNPQDELTARVVHIETLMMHMQRDFEQLSKAILEQQAELDALRAVLSRMESKSAEDPTQSRDLMDERPPHY